MQLKVGRQAHSDGNLLISNARKGDLLDLRIETI